MAEEKDKRKDPPVHVSTTEEEDDVADKLVLADEPVAGSEQPIAVKDAVRWKQWKEYLSRLLDFRRDKEDELAVLDSIREDVVFRGTKLWILICAMFVASLGLNVNSTAVIIGAMLISPLMGPIIGFGTALGIADFDLLKRSLRNLGLTTLFSILTATIYFLLSPISEAGSELLGRTHPTIFDVLIAFFGGAAGMIAVSTKNKGQVIPGVAIATALMPPLCTAGYSLANGEWAYLAGALYLYLINSIFIAFATYIVARFLRFPKKTFLDAKRGMRVRRWIAAAAVITIIPSIYLTSLIIRESLTQSRANSFVSKVFDLPENQVLKHELTSADGVQTLKVWVMGQPLTQHTLDSIRELMPNYQLRNVHLVVNQGVTGGETDIQALSSVLLKDVYANSEVIIERQSRTIDSLKQQLASYNDFGKLELDLVNEMKVAFPFVRDAYIGSLTRLADGADSVVRVTLLPKDNHTLTRDEAMRIKQWITVRTKQDSVSIIAGK